LASYKLFTTYIFDRKLANFLRRHPEIQSEIERKLTILKNNPFHSSLKTHKLFGKLKEHYAIWLTYEYRILFILEGDKIFLTNIGSHEEVY
jgi:mRNA-degrading endonuclease YafQ of YafQ-DinJ toxin-antitoxin module